VKNPDQSPTARIDIAPRRSARYIHSTLAFLSGMFLLPALGLSFALFFLGADAAPGNRAFWLGCFIGGLLAGAAVYPFKRIPHWLAVALGAFFALLGIVIANAVGWLVA